MDGAKTRDRILPPHPRFRAEDLPHLRRTRAFAPKTSLTCAGNAESKEKNRGLAGQIHLSSDRGIASELKWEYFPFYNLARVQGPGRGTGGARSGMHSQHRRIR